MNAIICEMCGSNNLIKMEGYFVCENCGTKYTTEEAKKLMVQGTVKIDNSDYVAKYLENARRARDKQDWQETEKYYNLVEQNEPDNLEAIFFSAYGKAKQTMTDQDIYKRAETLKVLVNCFSLISEKYSPSKGPENREFIALMTDYLTMLICGDFVYTEWKNEYGLTIKTNRNDTYTLFDGVLGEYKNTIDKIKEKDDHPVLHECLIAIYGNAMNTPYKKWNRGLSILIEDEKKQLQELEIKMESKANDYWKDHPEEKAKLDTERKDWERKLNEIESEIDNSSELKKYKSIQEEINNKTSEKEALGVFKLKEKKEIQTEIDKLQADAQEAMSAVSRKKEKYSTQIDDIKLKITEIDKKLKLKL